MPDPSPTAVPAAISGIDVMRGVGAVRAKGFWADAWERVLRRPGAVFGLCWIGVVAFFAVFAPLIANRSFLVMWLGQCCSQVADKLVFILLVALMDELHAGPRLISVALAMHTAPNVLFGAAAGVLVDRLDKQAVMVASNVARAALVLALGAWGTLDPVVAIALAFLVSSTAQPFIPAEAAAVPLVVGRDHILAANSVFAATMIGSIIVAFTLGEPLLQALGIPLMAVAIAAGFLASTAFLAGMRYATPDDRAPREGGFWAQLREGMAFIAASPNVRRTLTLQVVLFAMFAATCILAILFAKAELKTNFSWLLAAAGAGMAVGAGLVGQRGAAWDREKLIVGGFAAVAVALGGLPFLPNGRPMWAFAAAGVIGLGAALAAVPLQTKLTEAVDERLRGKVFGAQNMALNAATTLPLAGIGFVVEAVGLRPVLLATGGLMAIAAGWAWVTRGGSKANVTHD